MASSNAITCLNLLGYNFFNEDFSKISIPNADLSYSNCNHCNFKGANLKNVNFERASLWGAIFDEEYFE